MWDFKKSYGGGTEIRTLGTLRHGSFQDCCNQPLCHPSLEMWGEYIENCISYLFSSILIVEFEYHIWYDYSFWISEFYLTSHSFRKEKISNKLIYLFIEFYSLISIFIWDINFIFLIFHFLILIYFYPSIWFKESIICIIFYEYRLHIIYPIVEIDIIFYSYFW